MNLQQIELLRQCVDAAMLDEGTDFDELDAVADELNELRAHMQYEEIDAAGLNQAHLNKRLIKILNRAGVRKAADIVKMTAKDVQSLPDIHRDDITVLRNVLFWAKKTLKGEEAYLQPCRCCGSKPGPNFPLLPGLCTRCAGKLFHSSRAKEMLSIVVDEALESGSLKSDD